MTSDRTVSSVVSYDELELLDSDDDRDLRSTVAGFLADRCPASAVVALYDDDGDVVAPLWRGLAGELGLAGLLVPEEYGGAGAGAREAAIVLEELGRSVAPVPYLTSAVLAATVLAAAPALTEEGRAVLAGLAEGSRTAALVVPLTTAFDADVPVLDAGAGSVRSVAGALEADTLLVPVRSEDGIEVRALPASDARITPVVSLDMSRRLADVTIESGAGAVVVAGEAAAAVRAGLLAGTVLLASEQVGLAQWCLTSTVGYLRERRQFGRVVGGFQALKHRLADLYTAVEGASATARYAAAALAADPAAVEAEIAAHTAAAWCSEVAVLAAEEAVQLHGGIGMTWEHPTHLYLKRAKADQLALGLPGHHRARLGELVGLTV
ncbi:acyl-CoA/acyl-ACP dehydrogenase [Nocardioides sp. BP30]|uniref:acyl-CoA dehydrogenase family protein n=1 Tax=Nocardioides sp. BP30 TaxID=3036374 RepID=UPI0024688848|nr:acyl-CoA dehydrogenase family protein [Nocardioides sp. BP30]WGL53299.1 acyl-CoA/acyl-ACP dehydrogenase [Nocardioides sp. BP30]